MLQDANDLCILEQACHCLQRIEQAKAVIDKDGLFVQDRSGQLRAHPASIVELANKRTFQALLRELGLSVANDADDGFSRPPQLAAAGPRRVG